MLNEFQKSVLYIITFLFIVILIIVCLLIIYMKKKDISFPKQEQSCPDYWEDRSKNGDGSKCVNTKNLGNSRNKIMDFSKSLWKEKDGLCNKSSWAKNCNLSWDGITNNKRIQCNTFDIKERDYLLIKNTDYKNQFDIKNLKGNVDECKNECDLTKGCNAFVYDKDENNCYLKNINNKKSIKPSFSLNRFVNVVGKGFKSYKDADNICSSENKDEVCFDKIKEGFTNKNDSSTTFLKGSKCNVKLLNDGNLVIFDKKGKPLWSSNTYEKGTGPYTIKMHENGNLVIYDNKDEDIWQSKTIDKGEGEYRVSLDDTCTMGIYDLNNTKLWYVNESKSEKQKKSTCYSGINYGLCENKISSSTIDLVMNDDGNLIIYDKNGNFKWSSESGGKGTGPYKLMMKTNGQLVIYDSKDVIIWETQKNNIGKGPYTLTVKDDKNVVISSPYNQRVWSSRVDRKYNVLNNTNYIEGDINNFYGSITECKNECDYNKKCNSFFYDETLKKCFLKNVDKNALPKYNTKNVMYKVSGTNIKSFKDIERKYNLIENTDYNDQGNIKTMKGSNIDCMRECDSTKGCNSFFYSNEGECSLKGLNTNNTPNFNSNGSLYEAVGSGLKSYLDLTPTFNILKNQNTEFNSSGGGNTIFLDRQNVNCGDYGLNNFRLSSNNSNVRYDYSCSTSLINNKDVNNINIEQTINKSTNSNSQGQGNVIFLDRHNLDCGENSYISQFKLDSMGKPYDYQYNYTCKKSKKPLKCRTIINDPTYDGNGNFVFLDRQNVKCNNDEVINQFKLFRPSENTISYSYNCCKF